MKYAISTLMQRHKGAYSESTHHLCVVEGVSQDECLGKATQHAFAANKGYTIIGMISERIVESVSFPINVAWGSFDATGYWDPTDMTGLSSSQQRQQNIEGGYLCAGCDHKPSHCVCLKEGV